MVAIEVVCNFGCGLQIKVWPLCYVSFHSESCSRSATCWLRRSSGREVLTVSSGTSSLSPCRGGVPLGGSLRERGGHGHPGESGAAE